MFYILSKRLQTRCSSKTTDYRFIRPGLDPLTDSADVLKPLFRSLKALKQTQGQKTLRLTLIINKELLVYIGHAAAVSDETAAFVSLTFKITHRKQL